MRSSLPAAWAAIVILAALVAAGGCTSDSPFSVSEEGMALPATLFEALRLADYEARIWSENAQVTAMGGGFTVLDRDGHGRNHSFVFHARDGRIRRRLDMHLFGGIPYQYDTIVSDQPPPIPSGEYVDTDVAVPAAINVAQGINEAADRDSISVPEVFSAHLVKRAVWPEGAPDSVAWRVDFLLLDAAPSTGQHVWWTTARFYVDPRTAELYGDPVVPNQPELFIDLN